MLRPALAAALLLPLTGCETTKKTAEEEKAEEQYQQVTYTGSHFPKKVKKNQKSAKDPNRSVKDASYIDRVLDEQPQRGEGVPHPREAR